MMRAHGAQKAAVRNTSPVQHVASGVENKVDIIEIKARPFEDLRDDGRDEINVLRAAPGDAELRGRRCDHRNSVRHHVFCLILQASRSRSVYATSVNILSRKKSMFYR